ncbi:MAG: VWA domain-containing protein [Myxococcota bacterium]|jgi:uncharacterized membrane protein|nr:VWA domain-containing protein [Myxococcota bacterium]
MSPLLKRILRELLFYSFLAALWAAVVYAFLEYIWWPQNFTFSFTDHELYGWLSWVPSVDFEQFKGPEPIRLELTDLRWLGLLCALPVFILFDHWTLTDLPFLQRAFNIGMRWLLIIVLVGALLDLQRSDFESYVSTIVVVDVSESVPDEVLRQAEEYVGSIAKGAQLNDDFKVVTFSKRPRMLRAPGPQGKWVFERHPEEEDTPPPSSDEDKTPNEGAASLRADSVNQHTNIQDALRLAYGLFPPDHVKRLMLITDGNQTEGDLLGEAYNARTYGVRIYTKHFPYTPQPELMIRSVNIKDRDALRVGKPFEAEVELFSTFDTEASFVVWQGEFKEDHNSRTIPVPAGESFITFTSEPFNPGPVKYEIRMNPKGEDHYKGNNIYRDRLVIEGKPRVLYVEGNQRVAHYLQRALEGYGSDAGQNFIVDVRPAGGLPNSIEDALQFDAIILSDTPVQSQKGRSYVSAQNMRVLDEYVRRHGGGFIAIGGEQAFGLGGYQDTLIEKMLPVRFEADLKREHPSLALAIAVDKSGSMEGQKMELAKDAAKATVEVLGKNDQVMVIGFDDRPSKYVSLTRASNRMTILEKISRITPGGGTDIQPALEMAYLDLAMTAARIKHVILLTDGQAPYGTISELVRQMNNELITVSTIAVGNGADTVLLNMIADYGGGRAYFTNDPYSIPRIFLQETSMVTQNAIVEEPFGVRVLKDHSMIKGTNIGASPDLLGYVTTQKKEGAEVILANPTHNDPILATWRWGVGKTTVFTSDCKNRWATAWVSTRSFYPKFWAQVVRETMRRNEQTFFELRAELREGKGHVTVDAIDVNDEFINGLESTVKVTPPQGTPFELRLEQSAPGLYEGSFELSSFGPYYLEAVHREPGTDGKEGKEVAESRGTLSYPYPAEYFFLTPNTALVDSAVASTLGKVDPTVEELFDPEGQKVKVQKPMWPYFLWPALVLLMLDVLFRRVRFYGRTNVPWHKVLKKS